MRDIQHTRRQNLEFLVQECAAELGRAHGSVKRLAVRSGVEPSFLSMLLSGAVHSTTGKQRQIGDDTASKLERGMGKDPGWMDVDRSAAKDYTEARYLDRLRALSDQQRAALDLLLDSMTAPQTPPKQQSDKSQG